MRNLTELAGIETISGTAQDPDGSFRGFCTIRATDTDGNLMSGQVPPEALRTMALQFLETAEAAEQDRIIFQLLTGRIELPVEIVANIVREMRELRYDQTGSND